MRKQARRWRTEGPTRPGELEVRRRLAGGLVARRGRGRRGAGDGRRARQGLQAGLEAHRSGGPAREGAVVGLPWGRAR